MHLSVPRKKVNGGHFRLRREPRGEEGRFFSRLGHICRHANSVLWLGYERSLESLQWAARFWVYMDTFIQYKSAKDWLLWCFLFSFFKYAAWFKASQISQQIKARLKQVKSFNRCNVPSRHFGFAKQC